MAELVGRRWTSAILLAGQRGARRFSEYHLSVPGISDRLLAQRLKEVGGGLRRSGAAPPAGHLPDLRLPAAAGP
ncbi:winged helix-turn-helix transcriptional regulator [Nonomuraea thailandensis]|uniref:winged helix-turn-helix transcriptional regulator n=1 Tax=Nonomuraea thailandensis TaxID=1188745 RepID=UPI0027E306A3|nr:winged helix-turn-helix transcriptional regulator [Nonomuraea thailandensis]